MYMVKLVLMVTTTLLPEDTFAQSVVVILSQTGDKVVEGPLSNLMLMSLAVNLAKNRNRRAAFFMPVQSLYWITPLFVPVAEPYRAASRVALNTDTYTKIK